MYIVHNVNGKPVASEVHARCTCNKQCNN